MKTPPEYQFIALAIFVLFNTSSLQAQKQTSAQKLPDFRVDAKGFNSSPRDIKKVLNYTMQPLWNNFPDYKLEPIVVVSGKKGPIVLYRRNAKKEIVVKLDTHGTFWSQYAYQWAHEFCHILCGFRDDAKENKWFEETICEMASLYCMRAMSDDWAKKPPYPNWKNYAPSLRKYADNVMAKHEKLSISDLATYYRKHKEALRKNSTLRDLNATMAMAMLPVFEKNPSHWESVRYLNTTPAKKGMSLEGYFAKWKKDAPKKHHSLIDGLMKAYDLR